MCRRRASNSELRRHHGRCGVRARRPHLCNRRGRPVDTGPPSEVIVVRRRRTGHAHSANTPDSRRAARRVYPRTAASCSSSPASGDRCSTTLAHCGSPGRLTWVESRPCRRRQTKRRLVRRTAASSSSTCTPAERRRSPGGRAAASTPSASAATAARSRAQTRTAPSPSGTFARARYARRSRDTLPPAQAAVFSPDGRTLYTASDDGSVIVWDLGGARRLGKPFRYSLANRRRPDRIGREPEGSIFAVSRGPDRVSLWHAGTRTPSGLRCAGRLATSTISPSVRTKSSSQRRGVATQSSGTRRRGRPSGSFRSGIIGASSMSFSPDGLTLAIGRSDGIVALYDLRTGRQTAKLVSYARVEDLDFSPDGKLLATAGLNGTAYHLGRRTTEHRVPTSRASSRLCGSVLAEDGKLVAVGDNSGSVVFWKLDPNHQFDGAWAARRVGQPLTGQTEASIRSTSTQRQDARNPERRRKAPPLGRRHAQADRSAAARYQTPADPSTSSRTENTYSASSDQAQASYGASIPPPGQPKPAASPIATSRLANGPSSSVTGSTTTCVRSRREAVRFRESRRPRLLLGYAAAEPP